MKQFVLDDESIWGENSLIEKNESRPQTLSEKIEESKRALRLASDMSKQYYNAPAIVCYSGGKDSDVLLHLAESCLDIGDFEVLNSHTTVDAPETVYHIKDTIKRLNDKGIKAEIDYHIDENGKPKTMWRLIVEKQMPPTRLIRYCCAELKETSTPNRLALLGVREAESVKRRGRDIFGVRGRSLRTATFFSLDHTEEVHHEAQERDPVWDCTLIKVMREKGDTVVNPIYHWTDEDIWEYARQNNIKMNPLYSKGYKRVGCIGCPLASYREKIKEFADYPKYKQLYISIFEKMLKVRTDSGKSNYNTTGLENSWHNWETGEDVFMWWIEEYTRNVKGQMNIFDYIDAKDEDS